MTIDPTDEVMSITLYKADPYTLSYAFKLEAATDKDEAITLEQLTVLKSIVAGYIEECEALVLEKTLMAARAGRQSQKNLYDSAQRRQSQARNNQLSATSVALFFAQGTGRSVHMARATTSSILVEPTRLGRGACDRVSTGLSMYLSSLVGFTMTAGGTMITIDSREGSKELTPVLSRMGVPVKEDYLAYGDVMFLGRGPEGAMLIGIEYKKLSDLLQSWYDGRLLGHQLPGMQNAYDVNYLLIEGVYSCNENGTIQCLRKQTWREHESKTIYSNLRGWLHTLEIMYGVHVLESPNLLSSAVQVASI